MRTQEHNKTKWMVRMAGTALVATLTALVAIVAARRGGDPTRPPASDPQDDQVTGATEAGTTAHRATRSHARPGLLPAIESAPSYPVDPPGASEAAGAKAGAPQAPSEGERLAHAGAAFEAQAYDKSWAEPSSRSVAERLALFPDPSARPGPVKCRSTLCRLDVAVSGGTTTAESYLTKLVRGRLWDGPAMFIRSDPDGDGKVTLTLFLAKEDTVLPEPSVLATM